MLTAQEAKFETISSEFAKVERDRATCLEHTHRILRAEVRVTHATFAASSSTTLGGLEHLEFRSGSDGRPSYGGPRGYLV